MDVTEVLLFQRGLNNLYSIAPVERHTKTVVVVLGRRYNRKDGYEQGNRTRTRYIGVVTDKAHDLLACQKLTNELLAVASRVERAVRNSADQLQRYKYTARARDQGEKALLALTNATIALERAFDIAPPEDE